MEDLLFVRQGPGEVKFYNRYVYTAHAGLKCAAFVYRCVCTHLERCKDDLSINIVSWWQGTSGCQELGHICIQLNKNVIIQRSDSLSLSTFRTFRARAFVILEKMLTIIFVHYAIGR